MVMSRIQPVPDGRTLPVSLETDLVRRLDELVSAWGLVYRSYVSAGFIRENPFGIHTVRYAVRPDSAVMVLREESRICATVTAMGDVGDGSLALDRVFPTELRQLRREGGKLMELGLFAHEAGGTRRTAGIVEMLRSAFCHGASLGYTDIICGVAPHHARFYGVMCGFEPYGPEKFYDGLHDAPVVLLRADVERIRRETHRYRGLAGRGVSPVRAWGLRPQLCLASDEVRGSVIGQYLYWTGRHSSPACRLGRSPVACEGSFCA